MRALLICTLIACSRPAPAPQTTNVEPTTAKAEQDPIAKIRAADRALIKWPQSGKSAERTGDELKQLLATLVTSEQMPSGGEAVAYITFFGGTNELGVVWSYHDGEWGLQGVPKTLGLSPTLAQQIKQ